MKITNEKLEQIIKQELENIMETKFPSNPFAPDRPPSDRS